MGVPVLAIEGERWVSRLSMLALALMGMPEWIAHSTDEYVEKALALSGDLEGLERTRGGLRWRMAASAITDIAGFTAGLESAYGDMWGR